MLQISKIFAGFLGPSIFERLVSLLLLPVAASFLVVLITGGDKLAIGPFRLSASALSTLLLLLLAMTMIKVWLRGKCLAIPAAARLRAPLFLYLSVVFIYSLVGTPSLSGDTIPARYLPFSIIREFNLDLDEFPFLYEPRIPYFLHRSHHHIVSTHPPWVALLALPVYLLPALGGLSPQSQMIYDLEKLSGTLITALSVVFLLLALRRLTYEKTAWFITLVYAFGTSSLSTSSRGLWQHGPAQLFLALTIYCLVRGLEEPRFSAYAGFTLASAIICRPITALIALPIGAYMLYDRRNRLLGFFFATLPPFIIFVVYNSYYFDSPVATGFASTVYSPSLLWASSGLFGTPLNEGLMGILVSPGRGLFIYSPILLFSFVGMAAVWREPGHTFTKCLSLSPFPFILLVAKWSMWWGGWSYGPRLLADITPILCLFLYLPFEWSEKKLFLKYAIVALSVLSIGLHALGALNGGSWNRNPDIDQHPERLWSWMDSPPVYYGKTVVIDMRQALSRLKRLAFSMPSSRRAPQKLSAAYRLISSLDPEPTVYPYEFLNIHVHAHNTGEAIWLARAKDNKGAVRLGWRWLRGGQSFFSIEGREGLKYDIFPGEHYEFTTKIPSPREPGQYTLEIGLVSEGVTWFSDQGIQPLQVAVHVLSPPTQNFESLVAKDLKTVEDPPHIAIASNLLYYRGGDVCQVTVNVVNQNRPRIVDTYLALAWPNGRLEFWDGNKFLSYTAGPWIPLARRVELVQGFRIANQPLLQWKLIDMPSGPYTLYLILSESNAFRVIATAQASFELEP